MKLFFSNIAKLTPEKSTALKHFVDLFKDGTTEYINKLREGGKLKKVIVCSPYYYSEKQKLRGSNLMFIALKFAPLSILQALLKRVFELGTSQIQLPGAQVEHIAMYEIIDGKTAGDYSDGVHLSEQGGRKMVGALLGALKRLVA